MKQIKFIIILLFIGQQLSTNVQAIKQRDFNLDDEYSAQVIAESSVNPDNVEAEVPDVVPAEGQKASDDTEPINQVAQNLLDAIVTQPEVDDPQTEGQSVEQTKDQALNIQSKFTAKTEPSLQTQNSAQSQQQTEDFKSHAELKSFPLNINVTFETPVQSEPAGQLIGPFSPLPTFTNNIPNAIGEYNFTSEQQETIRQFRILEKNKKDREEYFKKRDQIQKHDDARIGKNDEQKAFSNKTFRAVIPRKNQQKHLTVHMVPHTHDDVGWIKTYEEYYTGFNGEKAHASVKVILSEVVNELLRDPKRKFTYVEMKYFNMWYTRQGNDTKAAVKMLIKQGRLEITQGGWVATDECNANYEDIIGNFQKGHQWLKDEFGVAPKIGWNIDAFGHTQANAALFHDFGFDALFFARAGRDETKQRFDPANQASHFLWRPLSKHFGNQKEILGAIFTETATYGFVKGFLWDQRGDDDGPIQDDPSLSNYNKELKCKQLVEYAQSLANGQANDQNVMALLGGDFTYENAYATFQNVDKLIKLGNECNNVNMTFIYSTPQTYVNALKKENIKWPIKYGDFLNYYEVEPQRLGRNQFSFWSGYYTSRPSFKKQIKDASALYYSQSKLFARKFIDQDTTDAELKEIQGASSYFLDQISIDQHHDAISGTATQVTTLDYQYRLQNAQDVSNKPYKKEVLKALKEYAGISVTNGTYDVKQCLGQQNDTIIDCPVVSHPNQDFIVAVHNSKIREHTQLVRVLLPSQSYKVQEWNKANNTWKDVPFDIIEQKHWNKTLEAVTDYEMFVKTSEIGADQISLLKLSVAEQQVPDQKVLSQLDASKNQSLEIQGFTGNGEVLFKYADKAIGLDQSFGISLKKYLAHQKLEPSVNKMFMEKINWTADEKTDNEPGEGAYLFKPDWRTPLPQKYSTLIEDVIYQRGLLLEQWTIVYEDSTTGEKALLKVRLSTNFKDIIEFEVELAPIPIYDAIGKDITVNWKMYNGFSSNRTFWTDSNSLEMQERNIRDLPRVDQTIAGNYYPVTSAIALRDHQTNSSIQVTVMNDRPQGGSADVSDNNTIELMQHRRILADDDKGVVEPLNETTSDDDIGIRVTAKYYMQIFDTKKQNSLQRSQQINLEQPLQYFFVFNYQQSVAQKQVDKKQAKAKMSSLVQLSKDNFNEQGTYKLIPIQKNSIMVRFENLADRFDAFSTKTNFIDLQKFANNLFMDVNGVLPAVSVIQELTIQGNMLKSVSDKQNPKWLGKQDTVKLKYSEKPKDLANYKGVALEPQRIRTFRIDFTPASVLETVQSIELHEVFAN